ncbi:MAG: aspartate kinase, partial [Paludibacteraceae bacterium]|nr:aspartate kinase [Paludibacteraceae bacterium]
MKVMKFGGTSVGSTEAVLNVKKIVESQKESVIVVVSALSGVTDQLYRISQLAASGNETYLDEYNQMFARHMQMIAETVLPEKQTEVELQIQEIFTDLLNIFRGIFLIKDTSVKITDTVVSYGEMISSVLIANIIRGAVHFDSRRFIKTQNQFDKHIVDFKTTNELIQQIFKDAPSIVVCGGFIATDVHTNQVTNLGRGGSDYTAAILAAALNASILEIWTDVDGFMTADPRIINNAYVIDRLSYSEAMELSNFGAKVIYPPTIFPAFH